jgi:hypothetical protein
MNTTTMKTKTTTEEQEMFEDEQALVANEEQEMFEDEDAQAEPMTTKKTEANEGAPQDDSSTNACTIYDDREIAHRNR